MASWSSMSFVIVGETISAQQREQPVSVPALRERGARHCCQRDLRVDKGCAGAVGPPGCKRGRRPWPHGGQVLAILIRHVRDGRRQNDIGA